MTIKVGDQLPDARLAEYKDVATEGCSIGPNKVMVAEATKGKKIAIFAVPGAFTPTCSEQHAPGYIKLADKFKAKGIDEIWCISVNDPFVMGAWARDQKAGDKVRFIADGSGLFTKALGLEFDLTKGGLGVRSQRYSMLVDNGVVKALNVEDSGHLENSTAEKLLEQI
ncbi:MAG TPA: peroxiredoxin [Oxalicibacterium sp.]|jgi:peroxiredoxin|nr:peroxiredoxin [Oxalicibacterium sp.]